MQKSDLGNPYELKNKDFIVLFMVYIYKCASKVQIFNEIFRVKKNGQDNTSEYMNKRLRYLCNQGLLEERIYNEQKIYSSTSKGIREYVRKYGAHSLKDLDIVSDQVYHSGKHIKVANQNLLHQLDITDILMQVNNAFGKVKHQFGYINNDAQFGIVADAYYSINARKILLELDRGTEHKKALLEKFEKYSRFFNKHSDNKDTLIVAISCCNINKRIYEIINCIIQSNAMYSCTGDTEIYVVSKEEAPKLIQYNFKKPDTINEFIRDLKMPYKCNYSFPGFPKKLIYDFIVKPNDNVAFITCIDIAYQCKFSLVVKIIQLAQLKQLYNMYKIDYIIISTNVINTKRFIEVVLQTLNCNSISIWDSVSIVSFAEFTKKMKDYRCGY